MKCCGGDVVIAQQNSKHKSVVVHKVKRVEGFVQSAETVRFTLTEEIHYVILTHIYQRIGTKTIMEI
jgi:hypothetical protein